MTSFKEPSLAERQKAAVKARKAALEKFRANAADPALAERHATRIAQAAERTSAKQARDLQKAERTLRDAEIAEQTARTAAEEAARDSMEQASRKLAQEAERKAGRDARYAARKARKR
jgi:hypothetical protein